MAALLSRRRLGTLGLLQSSGLALVEPSRLAFRGYAAAAVATKQNRKAATTAAAKAAPTTKSATPKTAPTVSPKAVVKKPAAQSTTTKTPPTSPKVVAKKPAAQSPITKTPLTPPKVAAKKPAAQSTATKSVTAPSTPPKGSIKKPASQSATTKALTAAATPLKVTAKKPAAQTIPKKTVTRPERPRLLDSRGKPIFRVPAKKFEELSEEEQLAQLEQVYSMSKFQPTRDIWGHSTGAFGALSSFVCSVHIDASCTCSYALRYMLQRKCGWCYLLFFIHFCKPFLPTSYSPSLSPRRHTTIFHYLLSAL